VPITKKQAENNLEQAVCAKLVDVTTKIDDRLKDHYSGDNAIFELSELDLSPLSVPSVSLRSEVISRVLKIYTDAGWEVENNSNSESPNIVFK